jgi:16S rRNA (guanine527-N7)-methyltransferase
MSRTTPFDPARISQLMSDGLGEMSLSASEHEHTQLVTYLGLMAKWNHVYNLSAIRELDKMVSHHLLDSLVIVKVFKEWLTHIEQPSVLDVGTGGGLPGVVLAIMNPKWHITLIDPVHKKTAFLTQVKSQLALTNMTVITGKVEDLPDNAQYDLITSRAFASVVDFVRLSEKVLKANGVFGAMKGVMPTEELLELEQFAPNTWAHDIIELQVPQLEAQRHLIKLYQH